jgi:ectoine hydroxylase-related dioxygenase (phytanoyl-CoA dioxygenase family)
VSVFAAEVPHLVPRPTRDLAEAERNVAEFGVAFIADALFGDALRRTREALYRAADDDRRRGRAKRFLADFDPTNQRVWNLLSRDNAFVDLAEHPIALHMVKHILGWPALLGNISANITYPGGGEMFMHADQSFIPEPWPTQIQGCNCCWAIDDFTDEVGATRIVPYSHRLHRGPTDDEQAVDTIPLEADAGTLIVFESRIWHRTGVNKSAHKNRAAVFGWYTKPIYRTQENWFLSLDPQVLKYASETMLTLLGYKAQGFGLVNGESPR